MLKKNIKVIALTGRSGSGKSLAAKTLIDNGRCVLDCDKIAADITKTKECILKLCAGFGSDILTVDGSINKVLLAKKAFSTAENTKKLTDITHPLIIEKLLSKIDIAQQNGDEYIYVDGAVIVEGEFAKYCDKILVVYADEAEQIKRIVARDNISEEMAKMRLSKQISNEKLAKVADFIVKNENKDVFVAQILEIDKKIEECYGKK